jgi:hypothetical protein
VTRRRGVSRLAGREYLHLGGTSREITKGAQPVLVLWIIVLALILFGIIGGVAIGKFLFLILIAAAILALFGLFSRTA